MKALLVAFAGELPLPGRDTLPVCIGTDLYAVACQRPFYRELTALAAKRRRVAGRPLQLVQEQILREMHDARNQIDDYLQDALDLANKALDQDESEDEYVMAGESRLLDNATAEEMLKLRELFDSFEQKKDLLHLLERCTRAEGVQIFIGEEAGYEVFGDYSVVTAPYHDGSRTLGVLGVIGPTRMAYERVIPIVDVTARMLSSALSV